MSRNRLAHDKEGIDPASSVRRIREDLSLLELPRQQPIMLPGYGWRPPEGLSIKINTDAAVHFDDGNAGAGGVARSISAFKGAWCKPIPGVTDLLIAEAIALKEGVIFATLRGYTHVIMETDCLEVVNIWNSRYTDRSVIAPILFEIGELALSFISFVVQHVIRSANGPAHLCAKRACTLNVTESWLNSTPSFLISGLLADCSANTFVQ
jgi:hypothetical protein